MASIASHVQTVLGSQSAEDFRGVTMTHEHLAIRTDFKPMYIPPADPANHNLAWNLKNLGWIRQNPYSHQNNLNLHDAYDAVLEDVHQYRLKGGKNIIEVTTTGLHRDIQTLKKIMQETKVNIVAGAGFYVTSSQMGAAVLNMSEEHLADVMMTEMTSGCDGTNIKAGVIGELGCEWPLTDFERKVLRAASSVQQALRCPVSIHPGRNNKAPEEIIRVVQEAGGDVKKVAMCHLDRTIQDIKEVEEFAACGCFCEWDLFGIETSAYQLSPDTSMPSDAQRLHMIKSILKEGYGDKILLAQDVHTKHRLTQFGGHGYHHVVENVVKQMKSLQIADEMQIENMLIYNPCEWLTFPKY